MPDSSHRCAPSRKSLAKGLGGRGIGVEHLDADADPGSVISFANLADDAVFVVPRPVAAASV
jgi:hypothetical protein